MKNLLFIIWCLGAAIGLYAQDSKPLNAAPPGGNAEYISLAPEKITGNVIKFRVSDNNKDLNVSVSNYQGRVLISRKFSAGKYDQDLTIIGTYLNPGLYILTFETTGYKMVKQVELTDD